MGKRLRKRVRGLAELLQLASDQQRVDDVSISLRNAVSGCKEIVACANGHCEVIARICRKGKINDGAGGTEGER